MFAILPQVFVCLLVPGYCLWLLCRKRYASASEKYLNLVIIGLLLLALFFVARWDTVSLYLRYIWLLLFVVGAIFSWRRPLLARPDDTDKREGKLISNLAAIAMLLVGFGFIAASAYKPADAVSIRPPLQDGKFYIAQGGGSVLTNYHAKSASQKYALDIGRINRAGYQTSYPRGLNDYQIYGQTIYSPCAGTVIDVVSNLPDLKPPQTDEQHKTGNHVVMECQGVRLVLAHMQKGSPTVKTGQTIIEGLAIGKVGNSGNTTQPHLHIHAVKAGQSIEDGQGVPLLINGKYLVRNSTF